MTNVLLQAVKRSGDVGEYPDRVLRHLVWRRLENLDVGRLSIDDGGRLREFGRWAEDALTAHIEIRDPRFYRLLVFSGSLGAAEAYIRGYWTCDDLVQLVRIFCRNASVSATLESGPARVIRPLARLTHGFRRNTLLRSRRNIAAHYDLGNEFFSLFLDETMAYSCGMFPQPESTLFEASVAKFEHVCHKLALTADDHLLEIGSGWGGFAVHAAQNYGCRVTTTTISRKQYDYSRQKVKAAGLGDRVTVLCEDYRMLKSSFDKLVSIEMIEAVGHQYFDTYFHACSERLKSHGMMLLQAIVIPDQRYARYRRSVDFIQRYIFPGGCLPSIGAICHSLGRATDFRLCHLEDITAHYAETLALWRQRFRGNLEQIRGLGFSEEFIRTWDFYFCYCEGGFRERAIGDVQLLLAKPEA
ncbi:MAG: class I SAM-dependent methyltransferase [Pirellulales bacterium]|nr:class I SAM-dependent methyltransferase [Pirellulales bacterium]